MTQEEIEKEISNLEAMAHLMLERCSNLKRGLKRSATGSAPRKGKSSITQEEIARVLAKRRLRIEKKINTAK